MSTNKTSLSKLDKLAQSFSSSSLCCYTCNGYYGPSFGQPVCATCHAFLYANDLDSEVNVPNLSQMERDSMEDDDADSGNDEPTDFFVEQNALSYRIDRGAISHDHDEDDEDDDDGGGGGRAGAGEGEEVLNGTDHRPSRQRRRQPPSPLRHPESRVNCSVKVESLSERLALLTTPSTKNYASRVTSNHVQQHTFQQQLQQQQQQPFDGLPPEVLVVIFSYLDDISLYAVGNVCRRWYQILQSYITSDQWQLFTRRRWPLFRPIATVLDWFSTYSALVESSYCLTCIYQMAEVIPAKVQLMPRRRRLGHDLRNFSQDPLEGIRAEPLDASYYHWQASITGPVGSPYEGGIFFLYLKVPFSFPWDPPQVRFLSRIFHPNISRHGDVGIDLIQGNNWSSSLTIPKVLISIQSLLTDPYCDICMEPEIGSLYRNDRKTFDSIARLWTWKYAIHDAIPAKKKNY